MLTKPPSARRFLIFLTLSILYIFSKFYRYGTFVSLQGLWLGPYLMDVHGYSPTQAGPPLFYDLTESRRLALAGSWLPGWKGHLASVIPQEAHDGR